MNDDLEAQLKAIEEKVKEHEKSEHELAGCVFILFVIIGYMLMTRH